VKHLRVITVITSSLLLWGWLSTPIIGVANTTDSPATIRFTGKTESSSQRTDDTQLHVTEPSKSSSAITFEADDNQAVRRQRFGWLPQTDEQWWLRACITGIGLLVSLISWQLINYLKKRSSLS